MKHVIMASKVAQAMELSKKVLSFAGGMAVRGGRLLCVGSYDSSRFTLVVSLHGDSALLVYGLGDSATCGSNRCRRCDNEKILSVCLSVDGDSSKGNDAAKMMGATLLEISCKFVSAFQNLRKSNARVFSCVCYHSGHHDSKAVRTREMSVMVLFLYVGQLYQYGSATLGYS